MQKGEEGYRFDLILCINGEGTVSSRAHESVMQTLRKGNNIHQLSQLTF